MLIFDPHVALARPGVLQTREGKEHHGELSFTNNAVQISNDVEVTSVPRAEIARLSFASEAITPVPESKGNGLGMLGYYFANTNVNGPVQVRLDPVIDFDWGTGEPLPGVGKDYFGVIWMGYLEAPASGEFTFAVNADDRARLQIGPDLVIEATRREQQEEASGKLTLEQGKRYPVTLLYQDILGAAKIRLTWSGPEFPQSTIPADRLHPASFVTEHAANIESRKGLLATSYEKPDFSGNTTSRIDRVVDSTSSNITRWTGQLRADHDESYTFYIATDGPVRFLMDGKPLIDQWGRTGLAELKAGTRLAAGQVYDIQLESLASVRLLWSSPSQPKSLVSEAHLQPFNKAPQPLAALGPNHLLPAGILLRNGSFVACRVESIEEDVVQGSRLLEGKRIPLHEVARIVCQPLPRTLANRITASRPGVLLANGDFVEGTFVGMEGTRVTISSVLMGLRSYDTTQQTLAVIVRETEKASPPCEIQLRDQSILFAAHVAFQPGSILLNDKVLTELRIDETELQSLRFR